MRRINNNNKKKNEQGGLHRKNAVHTQQHTHMEKDLPRIHTSNEKHTFAFMHTYDNKNNS